jgi:hypothetical protein
MSLVVMEALELTSKLIWHKALSRGDGIEIVVS